MVVVGGAGAGQLARWFEDKLAVTHSALSQLISHHQQQQWWHDPRSASLAAEISTSAALVDWKSQYRTHHSVSLPRHPRIYGAREGGLCGWLDGS